MKRSIILFLTVSVFLAFSAVLASPCDRILSEKEAPFVNEYRVLIDSSAQKTLVEHKDSETGAVSQYFIHWVPSYGRVLEGRKGIILGTGQFLQHLTIEDSALVSTGNVMFHIDHTYLRMAVPSDGSLVAIAVQENEDLREGVFRVVVTPMYGGLHAGTMLYWRLTENPKELISLDLDPTAKATLTFKDGRVLSHQFNRSDLRLFSSFPEFLRDKVLFNNPPQED